MSHFSGLVVLTDYAKVQYTVAKMTIRFIQSITIPPLKFSASVLDKVWPYFANSFVYFSQFIHRILFNVSANQSLY